MNVVAIPKRKVRVSVERADWVNMAAGSALVVGGVLLFTKRHRAGAAVAAAGTALALVEHRDIVRAWWLQIPSLVTQVQDVVAQVQSKVTELAARRDAIIEAITSLSESQEMLRRKD